MAGYGYLFDYWKELLACGIVGFLIGIVGLGIWFSTQPECYATQENCGIGYDEINNKDLMLEKLNLNLCCREPRYLLQGINLMKYWNIEGSEFYNCI